MVGFVSDQLHVMMWSCVAATAMLASGHETPPPDYTRMIDRFRMRYGKVYHGVGEESVRFDHVKASDVIRTTSAKTLTCWLAHRVRRLDA